MEDFRLLEEYRSDKIKKIKKVNKIIKAKVGDGEGCLRPWPKAICLTLVVVEAMHNEAWLCLRTLS